MAGRIPVLVKFPAPLLKRVEAEALKTDKDRMATIIALIERGLDGGQPATVPAPPPPLTPGRTKSTLEPRRTAFKTEVGAGRVVRQTFSRATADGVQIGPTRAVPGARLKK